MDTLAKYSLGWILVGVAGSAGAQQHRWPEPAIPIAPPLVGQLSVGGLGQSYLGGWAAQEIRDSLYQRARELLNRGEYRRSADLFREFRRKNTASRYAAPAMYWQAFALYRAGGDADLRNADELLVALRQESSKLADESEVRSLATRIAGALAARGDASAVRRLREDTGVEAACDREDAEIKAEALSALLQADPNGGVEVLRRVLTKKDECSISLRRRAVGHLARIGGQGGRAVLAEVAASDPAPEVRGEAIGALAQQAGGAGLALIGPVLDRATDDATLRAALSALARARDVDVSPLVRRVVERSDVSEAVRADAIRGLVRRGEPEGGTAAARAASLTRASSQAASGRSSHRLEDGDAVFLKGLYERTQSTTIRRAIVEAMSYATDAVRDGWVVGLLRNPATDPRERSALLAALGRSQISVEEIAKLYDAMSEREARSILVGILGRRLEPAATDKLVDIAKRGTDPSIRREAIAALARKNDPRTTKLLLELVEH